MLGPLVLLALGVLLAATARGQAWQLPRQPTTARAPLEIDVVWDDPESALLVPNAWVGKEVQAQFGRLGVRVRWRKGNADRGEAASACRVILLRRHPLERERGRGTMGFAQRDSQSRSVWLLLASVRRALGLSSRPEIPLTQLQRVELARALGRVAVHELIHVLVVSHPHAVGGVMGKRLDTDLLTADGVQLDAGTGLALRAALRPARVPAAASDLARRSNLQRWPYR